jgi:hypothetical protein
MKKLIIISCLAFPFAVSAQSLVKKPGGASTVTKKILFADQPHKSPNMVITRPPGTYDMRPDNMPCIFPDMAKLQGMPNSIRSDTKIPEMPNGLKPGARHPKDKTNTKTY